MGKKRTEPGQGTKSKIVKKLRGLDREDLTSNGVGIRLCGGCLLAALAGQLVQETTVE